MPTSKATGTQAAVIGTEHTLATITEAGSLVLLVDTNAMTNSDTLELRAKTKVTSGGTTREAYLAVYTRVQGQPVKISIPIPSLHECVFTLKQTAGTGRSFPYDVVAL